MANVLCVPYADPAGGHPVAYARNDIPRIQLYPDGQTTPSPAALDFRPGELLGDQTGGLGLRKFLAARGHALILALECPGSNATFDQALSEADIIVIQACWPVALTANRIARAPRLRLLITAGSGSDHIDLDAAMHHRVSVVEITQSDTVGAAEYAVMLVLGLVHNAALPPRIGHRWAMAERAERAYDLEGMHVGSVGAGRTGLAFLRRMRPFDVHLHYTDPRRIPLLVENELGLTFHPTAAAMTPHCDVVTVHSPLQAGTLRLFDSVMIGRMRRGAYLVNTSAAAICDPDAAAQALKTGRLAGYATDIDAVSPAFGTAAHMAGSTLSAQARYAAGTREVLEAWFDGVPIRPEYLIIDRGKPTAVGVRTYGLGR